MPMRKWLVLSFVVILLVWTVTSIWSCTKSGSVNALKSFIGSTRPSLRVRPSNAMLQLECESFKSAPAQITFLAGLIQTLSHEKASLSRRYEAVPHSRQFTELYLRRTGDRASPV